MVVCIVWLLFCSPGLTLDSSSIEGVVQECLMTSQFDHPHVVGLVGLGVDALNHPLLVMPYMGSDVRSYVRNNVSKYT